MIYWYFFNPQYVKKFPQEVREKAMDNLLGSDAKRERFRRIASHTSLPKRLAVPLVERAARKHDFRWADSYFKFLYFPLVNLRAK